MMGRNVSENQSTRQGDSFIYVDYAARLWVMLSMSVFYGVWNIARLQEVMLVHIKGSHSFILSCEFNSGSACAHLPIIPT